MVFVLKPNVTGDQINAFIYKFESDGFSTILSTRTEHTVVTYARFKEKSLI